MTSAAAAGPPAEADPRAGVMAKAWQIDVAAESARLTRYEFVAGQLVVVSARGLDVYDATTGAVRWHYYEVGRQLADYAVAGDAIVVTTRLPYAQGRYPDRLDHRTAGLDAATGRVLWRSDRFVPVEDVVQTGQPTLRTPSAGVAVLRPKEADGRAGSGLVAVDARSGRQRWTWTPDAGSCTPRAKDTDGSLLIVDMNCLPAHALYALDPATGAVRWKRGYGGARSVRSTTRGGITVWPQDLEPGAGEGFVLIGADGKELLGEDPDRAEPGVFAVAGDRAVLTYADGDAGRQSVRTWMAFVNTRTGKLEKRVADRGADDLVTVGSQVYGLRPWLGEYAAEYDLDPGLIPAAIEVIDPADARVTQVPLPFPTPGFWPVNNATTVPQVLMHGGRAYTITPTQGKLRIAAHAPRATRAPIELGGVPAKDWPDACEITSGAPGITEREHQPERPLTIGTVTIRGWSCEVSGQSDEIEVRIGWVAPTAQDADALLDPYGSTAWPVTGAGDEAYQSRFAYKNRFVMRVGRYIVVMDGIDIYPSPMARNIAEAVEKNLR